MLHALFDDNEYTMDRRLFIKALTTASIGIPILTACGGGSNNSGGGGGTGGGAAV